MILIPLEARNFSSGKEDYQIDLVLDPDKDYELGIYNFFAKISGNSVTISCDSLDSRFNPNNILFRWASKSPQRNTEYYKLGTFNLRRITLELEGKVTTPAAITLAIKESI